MKKITFFFAALLTASSMFAAGMQGAYTIGGAGADFASLYAACDSLTKAVVAGNLTGDVELLVAADLTGQKNCGIVNNTDFTVTLRPDKDEPRTISFNATTDVNAGPSGAIMIGIKNGTIAHEDGIPCKNIIIDGLASETATNKMVITTEKGYHNSGYLVVMYGQVTKSVIRNCKIINGRTTSSTYAVCFRSQKNGYGPKGAIVENCELVCTAAPSGQGVNYNGTNNDAKDYPDSCITRNNIIRASQRGIFFNGGKNPIIDGNKFYIEGKASGYLVSGIFGSAAKGTVYVRNNQFLKLATPNVSKVAGNGANTIVASGIPAGTGGTWEITNNLITGFDVTATGATLTRVLGIRCGNTCIVRHNTFILNALSNPTSQARTTTDPVACIYFATAEHTFENNILVLEETASNASIIRGSWESSTVGNDFYIKPADESKAILLDGATKATNFADLTTAQQTANRNIDPKFTEGYKFVAEKEIKGMKVNAIAGITRDIEGNERGDKLVYPGCFEPVEVDNIQYELNGGITNDFGWKNGEDMYQGLAADVIAAKDGGLNFSFASEFGTGKKRQTFGPANVKGNEGVAFDIQSFDLTFFTTAPYADKWGWLAKYLDAVNTAAGKPAATSDQAYMRYALAAFFSDSIRASYPESADYAVKGISTLSAYMPTWKHSYANDANPTAEITLVAPYHSSKFFAGWYDNAEFAGEEITTVDENTTGTLYARFVDRHITYVLNGGVSNDYGWKNWNDMYQALAADVIAAKEGGMSFSFASSFGKGKRETFGTPDVKGTTGVSLDIQTFDLTFFTTEPYASKWGWLKEYLDAKNTAAGKEAASSGSSPMRYALAAFFANSQRTADWPYTADFSDCGASTLEAYMPTWKHSYANDENPTEEFTLIAPYCGTRKFIGWYDNPEFIGDPVTTVDKGMIITLYAHIVNETPTDLKDVNEVQNPATKVMYNGQIYIIRDGHMFNMQGMLVK